MKMTPWFPSSVRPSRTGWYMVRGSFSEGETAMRLWEEGRWKWRVTGLDSGINGRLLPAAMGPLDEWRGIASKDGK